MFTKFDLRRCFVKELKHTPTEMLTQHLDVSYRYKDIVRVETGDICLDGGAFIGDTALYFTESNPKKVYSFEIDRRNIACLKTNIKNFGKSDIVEIVEQALGNNCGTCAYVPMKNIAAGHITDSCSEKDGYTVSVTTIDHFCEEKGISPNFIKLDIEGAEVDALIGAEKTIKSHRPKLAVCIYHKLDHRWEIPLLLHEYVPSYRFYLKKSQPHCETVLFAVDG